MSGHNNSGTRLRNLTQQLQDICCCLWVQITRRLISNNHLGLVQDGTSNGYALLLTTRQFVWETVGIVLHLHIFQNVLDAFLYLILLLPSCSFQNELQVSTNGTVAQQLEVLEDNAHLSAQGWNVFPLQATQVVIQHKSILCLIDVQFEVECFQQRALSCTYTSDDVYKLTFIHMEINVFQYEDSIFLVDIRFFVIY